MDLRLEKKDRICVNSVYRGIQNSEYEKARSVIRIKMKYHNKNKLMTTVKRDFNYIFSLYKCQYYLLNSASVIEQFQWRFLVLS